MTLDVYIYWSVVAYKEFFKQPKTQKCVMKYAKMR